MKMGTFIEQSEKQIAGGSLNPSFTKTLGTLKEAFWELKKWEA